LVAAEAALVVALEAPAVHRRLLEFPRLAAALVLAYLVVAALAAQAVAVDT
jgi:hypothetical protein